METAKPGDLITGKPIVAVWSKKSGSDAESGPGCERPDMLLWGTGSDQRYSRHSPRTLASLCGPNLYFSKPPHRT